MRGQAARVGLAAGDAVLDLARVLDDRVFARPSLNAFLAQGPARWRAVRERLAEALERPGAGTRAALLPLAEVTLHLPFAVADYVDFYSSLHHAELLGRLFRPGGEALAPSWRHLPSGYHGRAGSVVVSGTPVVRPQGQTRPDPAAGPVFGPTRKLDFEAEVGFVVGVPTARSESVAVDAFADHVFGVVLLNDWSARDVQPWESVPLGPHQAKSFATSISPWVVPLADLAAAWVPQPPQDPPPLPHLRGSRPWGLDLELAVGINGEVVSRPPFATMYWTGAQQLAHLTANGARLRTGDLLGSGTVSGPRRDERGSLIELSEDGGRPLLLADGTARTFLEDGDVVTIAATAPAADGSPLSLGEVTGRVLPARAAD